MSFPVAGVEAKLRGAEDRLGRLVETINRGEVTDLLKTRTDRDREGRVRVRVKELAEIPDAWHVWVGEAVHDMRSALDHIAYALNVVGSGVDPPPNDAKSQFPLYSNRADFRSMVRRGVKRPDKCMVGYFPRGARTAVERLQPYHRRNNLLARWLGVLAELSNIDKHRRFPLTAVMPMLLAFPETVEGHRAINPWTPAYRPLKRDATILRLDVPTLPASVKEPDVGFPYALGLDFHREAPEAPLPLLQPYEPVNFVLPSILENLRGLVLPSLAPFFERIEHGELVRKPRHAQLRFASLAEASTEKGYA